MWSAPRLVLASLRAPLILLTQETHSATGLYRIQWDGNQLITQELPLTSDSFTPGQWEHVTFAPAGIKEIPEVPPPN